MLYKQIDDSHRINARLTYPRGVRAVRTLVHTTIGSNSLDYLLGGSLRDGRVASADWLIDRDGTRHRLTRPGHGSYHSGLIHRYLGYGSGDDLSRSSVGVELENTGAQWCTWQQLDSLAELLVDVLAPENRWAFPFDIIAHSMVASPYGRRSDPTGFNWGHLMGYIYAHQFKGR